MSPPGAERRPQAADPEAAWSLDGDSNSVSLVTAEGRVWTGPEWRTYIVGYQTGFCDGIDHGRYLADAEAAEAHRRAGMVLDALAKIPARDREADRSRAERRAARFGQAV